MSNHPNIRQPATTRWLSIIGIGADGIEGLSGRARELIESAEVVFGGARHLSLAAALIRGRIRPWESPFDQSVAEVLALRGRAVCVLASGDPFQHGVGSLLSRHVDPDETTAVPVPSAFSLAASRLLWALPQTSLLSLCGRPLDFIRPLLQPGARILALTTDSNTPAAVAHLLCTAGFGASRVTVLEALGAPRERIRTTRADEFDLAAVDPLNVLAIELASGQVARSVPWAPGLADDMFEHDGQITKREIRALTLSSLAPRHGEHLWDVGSGSGSVAIEWMLVDTSMTAVAIERRGDRAARIRRNAAAFGVPNLELVEAEAPRALDGLRPPHAAFIGGGATTAGLIDFVQDVLRSLGRLVINAVTLETESLLLQKQAQFGGTLTRLEVSRAGPVGGEKSGIVGWRPAMPVTQWTWVKP